MAVGPVLRSRGVRENDSSTLYLFAYLGALFLSLGVGVFLYAGGLAPSAVEYADGLTTGRSPALHVPESALQATVAPAANSTPIVATVPTPVPLNWAPPKAAAVAGESLASSQAEASNPSLPFIPQPSLDSSASSARPSSVASPPVVYRVGNTGGEGVYLRRTPRLNDRVRAWPDNTTIHSLEERVRADGLIWLKVRDPRGEVGWIPERYLIAG